MISGTSIFLRPAVREDAKVILEWENNPEFWPVTETPGPFEINDIRNFIKNSSDLFGSGQLRMLICLKKDGSPIGALDLFDFNAKEAKAGIGILIGNACHRNKGIATEAINTLLGAMYTNLRLKKLECLIFPDNLPSIKLFEKCAFKASGVVHYKNKKAVRYTYCLNQ